MKTHESIYRDILRLFIWFPFRWLLRIIPVEVSFLLFKLFGGLHFCIERKKKKRKPLDNFKGLLHLDNNSIKTVKKYYELHYLDRLHIFLYPKLTAIKKIEKYVCFENIEALEEALKNGRGALLVQPHFGPIQITLLSLALYGYSPLQIGYPTDKGLSRIGRLVAFKYRLKYEAILPAPIIPADKYLGSVYKHLKKGGVVLTTGDGAGGGIFLGEQKDFKILNKTRKTPLGPASWSLKTGAAYIPTFIIAENYKRFRIVFEKPISGIYNDADKDKIYITKKFIDITEHYIKKYPFCWHFLDEI